MICKKKVYSMQKNNKTADTTMPAATIYGLQSLILWWPDSINIKMFCINEISKLIVPLFSITNDFFVVVVHEIFKTVIRFALCCIVCKLLIFRADLTRPNL